MKASDMHQYKLEKENKMDIKAFTIIAERTMSVLQPYWPIIAAKTAETLGKELPATVGKLWAAIKAKIDIDVATRRAMERLLNDPKNEKLQNQLEGKLEEFLEADSEFMKKLQVMLEETKSGEVNYYAVATEGSAVAQGQSKAVGAGGIIIEGNVTGDFTNRDTDNAKQDQNDNH